MKLKKIASLMLAGVMAASMLAGCNTTSNQPQNPNNPVQPGTNGLSDEVADLIGEKVPEYVTFKDDTKLDDALKFAVEFAGVNDILRQYMHDDTLQDVDSSVYERLAKAIGDDITDGIWYNNIGDEDILQKAEEANSYQLKTVVASDVTAVSSTIGENAVKTQIAEKLDDVVAAYKYSTKGSTSNDTGADDFNFEYTVSVSTYTKTIDGVGEGGLGFNGNIADLGHADSAAKPGVTFVAIQVVRTAEHQ